MWDGDRVTRVLAAAWVAGLFAAALAAAPGAAPLPVLIGFVAWALLLFAPLVALSRIAAALILLCGALSRRRSHRPPRPRP